jgi:hypothetical protein
LLGHFGLVQALQGAIVALVQAPAFLHGQPGAVHLVQAIPQRVDGALEHAGEGDVELVALGLEQLACDMACDTPVGVRSTSVQPVKRFSRFQVDSPWRIRTSLCMVSLGKAGQNHTF